MKIQNFATDTFQSLKSSAVRFPLSVICAFVLYLFLLNNLFNWYWVPEEKQPRAIAVLTAGFFWFGGFKLLIESVRKSQLIYLGISLPVFAAAAAYIYNAHYGASVYIFLISGLVAFVSVAPFLLRKSTDAEFYNFNREMWLGFFYSILLSIIFCASLSAIIYTIQELFGVKFTEYDNIYGAIWFFGASLLAPYYALSWVRRDFSAGEDAYLPKGIKFILSYILVPFGILYLGILYIYAIKILLLWNLPQGKLSYMVCGFGAAGSFVHLAAYPLRNSGNYLVRLFQKYFCVAFLPLIPLLFLAINIRISQYGVTESRYAIVLAAIWFTATTVIYLLRRDNNTMKYGPALLALFLVLAAFGPWGAVSISEKSQVARLEMLLKKNHILNNGKIKKTENEVSIDDRIAITTILAYMTETDKLNPIKPWFQPDDNIYHVKHRYESYDILKDLGVSPAAEWNRNQIVDHNKFRYWANKPKIVDVKGYDNYYTDVSINNSAPRDLPHASINNNSLTLKLFDSHEVTLDLTQLAKDLKPVASEEYTTMKEPLILTGEDNKVKVKLIITAINGTRKDGVLVDYMMFGLLIKNK